MATNHCNSNELDRSNSRKPSNDHKYKADRSEATSEAKVRQILEWLKRIILNMTKLRLGDI